MAARRASCARISVTLALACGLALAPSAVPVGNASLLLTAAAHAIGEEDDFRLPLSDTSTFANQGKPARFDLRGLINDADREALNFSSVQLDVADGTQSDVGGEATVEANGTRVTIPKIGAWEVSDGVVTFTPGEAFTNETQRVQITMASNSGHRSQPSVLIARYPNAPDRTVEASEGVPTRIPLGLSSDMVLPNTARLTLEDLPAGSTLTRDGKRLVVPGEGTWTLLDEADAIEFAPARLRLGQQPRAVHYTVNDHRGTPVPAGTVTLKIPVIAEVVRSNPYGEPVDFDLSAYSTNIEPSTLELVPYTHDDSTILSADAATVEVKDQGTWKLDRAKGALTFTPLSAKVTDVTPVGVRGEDIHGHESSVAPISVGYPEISSHFRSFTWGSEATFTPVTGTLNVQPGSFAFEAEGMPAGTVVSEDKKSMTVPNEGRWALDPSTYVVSFTPSGELDSSPTPAVYSVRGAYAGNEARATLNVQYANQVPTSRDDEASTDTASGPITIDVLANDTPASASQALDAGTLQLRSAFATNVADLIAGTGKRLVIPDEGTFQVTDAGAVQFTPVSGFRGRTKPVDYLVEDSQGLHTSASLVVEVDHMATVTPSSNQESGINALLARILPGKNPSPTFAMYASITALLCFTGTVSLWVGRRLNRGGDR